MATGLQLPLCLIVTRLMETAFPSDTGPSHVFCPSCVGRVEASVSQDDTGIGFSDIGSRDAVTVVRCPDCQLVLSVEVDPRTRNSVPTSGDHHPDGGVIHGVGANHVPGDV